MEWKTRYQLVHLAMLIILALPGCWMFSRALLNVYRGTLYTNCFNCMLGRGMCNCNSGAASCDVIVYAKPAGSETIRTCQHKVSGRSSRSSSRGGAKAAISCFTCYSYNGSDENCADPFHPAYAKLSHNCKQGWEGRAGLFPAKYCIKVKGVNWVDGSEMIVRSCGMKSMDNMCGHFRFDNTDYQGCMMSCNHDACNGAGKTLPLSIICAVLFVLGLLLRRSV